MATVIVEVTIEDVPELGMTGEQVFALACDAFAARHNRPENVLDENQQEIPNPESKDAHLFRKTIDYWRAEIGAYMRDQVLRVADAQAAEQNESLRKSIVESGKLKLRKR